MYSCIDFESLNKDDIAKLLEIITQEATSDKWRRYNQGFGNWDVIIPGELKWECQHCTECCKGTESKVISLRSDEEGTCKHLVGSGCDDYEHRPLFCKFFPFRIIRTRGNKGELILIACVRCPGMGKGKIIGIDEYLHLLTYWSTEELWVTDKTDHE